MATGTLMGCILTKGKSIAKVCGISIPVKTKTEIIGAGSLRAMPGLIGAHSHIGISGEKTGSIGNDSNETTEYDHIPEDHRCD